MNALRIKNSCGGQGCEVAEHIKRTGYDGDFDVSIDVDNKTCYIHEMGSIGDLVVLLEEVFYDEWPEVKIKNASSPALTWTTTTTI